MSYKHPYKKWEIALQDKAATKNNVTLRSKECAVLQISCSPPHSAL